MNLSSSLFTTSTTNRPIAIMAVIVFLKVEDMEGQTVVEDNIDAVEEVLDVEEEDEEDIASDKADEGEEE
jgi:hypothetical protein